jgi:hypothetical protein
MVTTKGPLRSRCTSLVMAALSLSAHKSGTYSGQSRAFSINSGWGFPARASSESVPDVARTALHCPLDPQPVCSVTNISLTTCVPGARLTVSSTGILAGRNKRAETTTEPTNLSGAESACQAAFSCATGHREATRTSTRCSCRSSARRTKLPSCATPSTVTLAASSCLSSSISVRRTAIW